MKSNSVSDDVKSFFKKPLNENLEPTTLEVENQGTKEPRKEATKEGIKIGTLQANKVVRNAGSFLPNFKDREGAIAIPTNVEIYEDQLEAINELIFRRSKRGKKTLTKKQFVIEAIDEYLSKEFKKLN